MATRRQFAQALLAALHLPVNDANTASIIAWQVAEGGHWNNGALYNPLNTTLTMPGSVTVIKLSGSIGIQAYVNWEEGLSATAKTLAAGIYAPIRAALSRSASVREFLQAVDSTPWGTHFNDTQLAYFSSPAIQSYGDTPDPHPQGGPLPAGGGGSPAALLLVAGAGLYAYAKGWLG
ncbi:MAG TPA: hypothetical protein VMV37_01545 [Gammaproteobacteria bacterium]|nr:hypothetical protein [Gammaproteobacteria bacterium]